MKNLFDAFDLMVNIIMAEGGDGDGLIICRWTDFNLMVDEFDKYNFLLRDKFEKTKQEGYVVYFRRPEETLIIANKKFDYWKDDRLYIPTFIL